MNLNLIPRKKGVIRSVNTEDYTATVLMSDEEIILQGVKVCSVMTNPDNQINLIESMVNMQVWIVFDQHDQPYITMGLFNDEDKPNQDYNIVFEQIAAIINDFSLQGTIELNTGNYGGLVIAQNIVDKINRLENNFNTLVQNLTSGQLPYTSPAGPAVIPTAQLVAGVSQATPITTASDIENTTITHGDATSRISRAKRKEIKNERNNKRKNN